MAWSLATLKVSPATKICSYVDRNGPCLNVQPCPTHPKVAWQGSDRRAELPSNWTRHIVPRILARDPICTLGTECRGLALSREVHHIGRRDDHSDQNLAGVCKACHKVATQRQAHA